MHKDKSENPEFEAKKIRVKVDEAGKVSAVIATFNVEDHDGDIVEPTAFKGGQEVAMVWAHDWSAPVGKGMINVTESEAIFEGQFFMDTEAGMEAYKTVKNMANLQEWSWGFHTTKSSWEEVEEHWIRHLIETEVYEVSPVLKGAGIGTRTLAVKNRQPLEAQIKNLLEDVDLLGERVRSVKGIRAEEGRGLSASRMSEVTALSKRLKEAADNLEDLLSDESETQKMANAEFIKFLEFESRLVGVGRE